MLVLDSDLMSILQQGPPAERARLTDWLRADGDDVAVTIITFEEQVRGWMAVVAKAKLPRQQVPAYARLRAMVEGYQHLPLVDFDDVAAVRFADLRRRHRRHGSPDLKIAAIVLAVGARLLSRNVRDFEGIDGLNVQNPLGG